MKKINKATARKIYNAGKTVSIIASKMAMNSPWELHLNINLNDDLGGIYTHDFNIRVANFEIHNCNYETGYKCAYYMGAI